MTVATQIDVNQLIASGMNGVVEKTVEKKHTGHSFGNEVMEDLLTTPAYVDLMIRAAVKAVEHYLPKGFMTVGRSMEFTHDAPTGAGMFVSVVATVTEVKGKRILFEIVASDELGEIGRGKHERVVVHRDEWTQKVKERLKVVQRIEFK